MQWRVDSDKHVVTWNFARRGWTRAPNTNATAAAAASDWHIYWASKPSVKLLFHAESGFRFRDGQYLNHFPNHYELTRKDLLVKNIKRYRKDALSAMLSAQAHAAASAGPTSSGSLTRGSGATSTAAINLPSLPARLDASFDFLPQTYALPAEYALFVEEFRRHPHALWILKPCARSQGKGIVLVNKLAQTKKWAGSTTSSTSSSSTSTLASAAAAASVKEGYVVSKYIEHPLLLGGKKFDLRMYVLVLSYRPLQALVHREGFARFCNAKYSVDVDALTNPFVHLTNVAVQKTSDAYNAKHGGKWSVRHLLLHVEATRGRHAGHRLRANIHDVMRHALRAVQPVILNDAHCFECYGFDIIVDAALKPWLVEVNASPSLSTTTREDRNMKSRLVRDVLQLAVRSNTPGAKRDLTPPDVPSGNGFEWLVNDAAAAAATTTGTASSQAVSASGSSTPISEASKSSSKDVLKRRPLRSDKQWR